ncbi:MAG: PilT/PilU family type 4a pilus ATPase [Thermodesulfobacteriota bacterium]
MEMLEILETMVERGGSDVFLASGSPPRMNVDGRMEALNPDSLSPAKAEMLIRQMLSPEQWQEFLKTRELNIAYSLENKARFRVNVYFQKGTPAAVIRQIKIKIPTVNDLNLSPLLEKLILSPRGLILVTGATGSGKSTTMAAMIDYRAAQMEGHIVTIEDPIEFVFEHKKSMVTQREVGLDTYSFKEALKNSLRQAPNVIYIGELRDGETVQFALHCAETGHLVLSTLHSTNAPQTIERILNFFSKDHHPQVLMQLSYNLRAIISQRLIPLENKGRYPVLEILINTAFVQETIQKGDLGQLKKIMEAGKQEGMQTFDLHLQELVEKKIVSEEKALAYADSPSDLRLKLRGFV